jgi:hypothetical protein
MQHSLACETFLKIGHVLGHKASLNKYKTLKQLVAFHHINSGMKLETSKRNYKILQTHED